MSQRMEFRFAAAAIVAGALVFPFHAQAADGAAYFSGKTAEWIVGSAPGGGHDFFARLTAQFFERHLPGVKFVVRNRPGAGHIIAANLVYTAAPNGLTVGSFSTGLVYAQIQKKKGIQFDLAKMSWIGKAQSDWRVLQVTAKNTEFNTIQDILTAKRELKFSASGIGAGSYNDAFLFAEAYKLPYRIIVGYSGAQAPLGMLRGETDVLMGSLSSGEAYERAGQLKTLMQFGKARPGLPDARDFAKTPVQKALSDMMENQGKLSRITAGPPAIRSERLAALRDAYRKSVADKEYVELARKAGRELDPLIGDDVRDAIVALLNQPPEVLEMLNRSGKAKVEKARIAMLKHAGPITKIVREGRELWLKHGGKDVKAKVSGSRTTITVGGKKAKRSAVKLGMKCAFIYPGPGQEAKSVDCEG